MVELIWLLTLILIAAIFVCFTFVVLFGAPYLPTLKPRMQDALDLLNLKEGQTLLELGSGDGRVLKEAAKRGIASVGIEFNPLLVIYSKITTFRYRKLISIRWGNFWNMELPKADGVFVFLLDRYMKKLDVLLMKQVAPKTKLVSFAFKIPGKKIHKQKNGLFLYIYPSLKKINQ